MMKRTIVVLLLVLACLNVNAQKKDNAQINLNGYGRGSVFGGGTDYDLASAFAEFSFQASLSKGNALLVSDIRFRTGMAFGEHELAFQIKELYAGYKGEKLSVLLGNQIVNWGRSDGFNPTNNITPDDYFFLSSDPADQRLSNFMLTLNYYPVPGINLEVIGIPFYKMSDYRFDLFDMGDYVLFGKDIVPDRTLANGAVAVRVNFDFPAAGGSLSWFRGYDPYHGFNVTAIDWSSGQPLVHIASEAYRKTSLGADFALPLGRWIIRAEAAYNGTDNPDNKMFIPKPDLSYVAGVETHVAGCTLIGQYIGKYTLGFEPLVVPVPGNGTDPMAMVQYTNEMIGYENRLFNRKVFHQQEKANHAVSFTVTRNFAYDVIHAEFTAYFNITSNEWLLRPKVTWKVSDALSACIGGNYMKGDAQALFGYSAAVLNGAFLELKVSF
jgi:hypothetical protein